MPERDPATGRFKSSGSSGGFSLGSAFATIEIDASGIAKGITAAKKGLGNGLKDIGKSMTSLGTSMLGLTAPFLAFGAAAVSSFAESEKVTAQLDAVLKSTGQTAGVTRDMAISLADGFQQVTEFSDEAVLSGENMLLTFTNIGKDVFPLATQTILDMSTAMGQDLQSSAVQLGKALQDPIAGVSALARVGVNFSDAQKEMIKQMVAAGDVAGAQKFILAELQKEFGGSAEAAGKTFAGSLVILKNQLDGIMESIGGALIPVLQNMMTSIMPIVNQIAEWITKNPELVAQIGSVVIAGFALGTVFTVVGTVLSTVGTVVGVLSGAIAFLLSPVGLLIAAIAGIIYVANELYPGGLKKLFSDASVAAGQLGVILFGVGGFAGFLNSQVEALITTIMRATQAFRDLQGIGNLLTSGQVTPGQVLGAVGNEISNNAGFGNNVPDYAKNFGKRAEGGDVFAGMRYLVGERGSETFTAPANGTITPAGEGGGNGIHIENLMINANTSEGGRAAARGFKEELESMYRGRGNS